jgi:hypothetical protein
VTLEQDFRSAWLDAEGDTYSSRLARRSLEASAQQTPELAVVLFELKNKFQAELDLHLEGVSVGDNRTNAFEFANLIRGISDSVHQITKNALGRQRMSPGLLVSSPLPGSVRVVLSAAASPEVQGHLPTARTETQDSNSLRLVATVLARAGDDADNQSDVVEGILTALPFEARAGLRRAAKAVSSAEWTVSGELRRPTQEPEELHLTKAGAAHLLSVLDVKDSESTTLKLRGSVDGQRRSMGTMWFVPVSAAPIEASVVDQHLLDEVAALGASGDEADATFTVVSKFAPGLRASARRSYVLTEIEPRTSTAVPLDPPSD